MPYPLKWTDDKLDLLRQLSVNHTQEEAAKVIGVSYDSLHHAASKFKIRFIQIDVLGRRKRKNNVAVDVVNRIIELASTHSSRMIAEKLGVTKNVVIGVCNRLNIRTAGNQVTETDRLAKRAEYEAARRARLKAIKPRAPRVPVKRFVRKNIGFELVYRASPTDRKIVEIERAARKAETERRMSTLDVCRLFAAGKIDRHEMSRRLTVSQRAA